MKKKKKKELSLDSNDFKGFSKRWQRCRSEDLPGLFYAYDQAENQTERIVSFFLDHKQVKELKRRTKSLKGTPYYLVYLGLEKGYDGEFAPEDPHFKPILQVRDQDSDQYTNGFLLQWDADPSFPTNPNESIESGPDAISGAAAFLFAHHWLETRHEDLGVPFESNAYMLGRRVKAYRFSNQESQEITKSIANFGDNPVRVYVHLGRGISVSTHPFSFRPVLQVKPDVGDDPRKKRLADEDDDTSYYDFSQPIPPQNP
ncbi:hypothetical protein [Lewinella sp. W8]|uniref:hypothetical protein n=1 Tax=Lewinella sp. W8 TaxID=2528208 RepID=UPI00106859FD|nr:hypothetical protein [Lewinella sp. W8]MTB52523.1 hypothetical protein [Lewinella sp. W8]